MNCNICAVAGCSIAIVGASELAQRYQFAQPSSAMMRFVSTAKPPLFWAPGYCSTAIELGLLCARPASYYMNDLPLIGILRGVMPDEALDVVGALAAAGFRMRFELPQPLHSIEKIATTFADQMLVGAGTVLTTQQVADVRSAGGQLVVSPNTADVIQASVEQNLVSVPCVATPSEAFPRLQRVPMALKRENDPR